MKSVNQNYLKIHLFITLMSKPKYQIGDRIPESELVVRGIAPQKCGEYIYFVQIISSDNLFVGTENDLDDVLAAAANALNTARFR